MRIAEEMEGPSGVRARLAVSTMQEPDGDEVEIAWVLMQRRQAPAFVSRERFWLVLGYGDLAEMRDQAAFLCNDLPDDDVAPMEQIDRGAACVGRQWSELQDPAVAARVLCEWEKLPAEVEALHPEMIWRVRGMCFGEPFTRVARACVALIHFYSPDQPVPPELIVGGPGG